MDLKEYLKENGIKTVWFAMKMGVTAQHLRNIMEGYRVPGIELARDISSVTNGQVTFDELRTKNWRVTKAKFESQAETAVLSMEQ